MNDWMHRLYLSLRCSRRTDLVVRVARRVSKRIGLPISAVEAQLLAADNRFLISYDEVAGYEISANPDHHCRHALCKIQRVHQS